MSFIKITNEIAQLFKFANPSHPSKPVNSWLAPQLGAVIASIYQRSVSCNVTAQLKDISSLKKGANVYFCGAGEKRTWEVEDRFKNTHKHDAFESIWRQNIFTSKP